MSEVGEIETLALTLQAADGRRDLNVNGVQTCALPIVMLSAARLASVNRQSAGRPGATITVTVGLSPGVPGPQSAPTNTKPLTRSEERRVGKERRSRWSPNH